MKKPIILAIALVLALTIAACGGNSGTGSSTAEPPSGGVTTEPSSGGGTTTTQSNSSTTSDNTTAPPSSTTDDVDADITPDNNGLDEPQNTDQADVAVAAETTPVDGDFMYLLIGGLDPNGGPSGINTQGLYQAEVVFSGNTEDVEYLDFSEFTVYMDGEPLAFSVSNVVFMAGIYNDYINETYYQVYLSETSSETDPPIPFTGKAVKVWLEAVIGGSEIRSRTLDWREDGGLLQLDDASISKPLKLEAAAPPLPDFTEEEFYAYHYINDDEIPNNGTPPVMPAPLENHRGDKAFFYVTSDDYIIRSFSSIEPITNVATTSYEAYSFIDGVCEIVCDKTVYDSLEDSFAVYRMQNFPLRDISRDIMHIDNARYREVTTDASDHFAIGMKKSEVLEFFERNGTADIYDSVSK